MTPCIFCQESVRKNAFFENEYFYSVFDIHPVAPGHALVITKRHVENVFELTKDESALLSEALQKTRKKIEEKYPCTAFNIGTNVGNAAGQLIM
ncbi:HIT family protein, partial [Candidatus Micrarchaeota archaeon]|nr:HIT family protein [Candidatus Micrarchaeota archaeon]